MSASSSQLVVENVAGALLKSETMLHHVVKVSPTADKPKRITNTRSHSKQIGIPAQLQATAHKQ